MNDSRFLVSGWEDDLNDINEEKQPHETPQKEILWAAENGKLDKIKELIAVNPKLISESDSDGYTPLHRACYGNFVDVVDYLLAKGADVSCKTQMQWQPLHSCCHWNSKDCAIRLIQHGADVNATSEGNQTPLHIAASNGAQYDTVQFLLMHPYMEPYIKNRNNETAFDIAKRSSKYYRMFEMVDPIIQGIPDL
ncbi:cyclin-dependent kinase inhibitor 2c-related [Holotrichia oblita]|uniref:Cyclin-dependent kinase inhibitor 2c-related n=1 Tax=Holotrichia oblita TaxID=644536 RepID=A0ACB9TUC9_HOLOL|nr:cyclin-dependent kinase inhibitor 2c-related [Holotrichia oblita]